MNDIADSISSKTTADISVSGYCALTAAVWLSYLNSTSDAFDVNDTDIPVFSAPSENSIYLTNDLEKEVVITAVVSDIPAKAKVHEDQEFLWTPAFTGMTVFLGMAM